MSFQPIQTGTDGSGAWFRALCAVTGVGSLPHVDPVHAVDFVARNAPEVPFWPQLRRRSARESMVPQTFGPALRHLVPVRGEHAYTLAASAVGRFAAALERDAGNLQPANAAGFFAFTLAYEDGAFPAARAVKGHAMGPVTLACSLLVDGTPFLDRDDLRAVLADHVVRLARWQVDELQRLSSTVILVLDEAYLGVALRQDPSRIQAATDLLRSVVLRVRRPGVLVGMHCCDRIPLGVLSAVGPDLFSFDAHSGGDVFAGDPDARRFLGNGGRVAWGWIPTRDDLADLDAEAIASRWWDATASLSAADDGPTPGRVRDLSLVTAACGLAGSSEATCERSFALAREVGNRYAGRCGEAGSTP